MTRNYKLNKEGKDALRKQLDEELSKIEFNPEKRIKIPLETLEMLMFDYDKKNKCKKIGFISDNLCKIDLSELSFEDVNFYTPEKKNFYNTNIKINLNEVHRGTKVVENDWICFKSVSFENVDLSNNDISNFGESHNIYNITFEWCNLANTGLKVCPNNNSLNTNIRFVVCNLKNVDLSTIEVSFPKMQNDFVQFASLNNLNNTKLTFITEPKFVKDYFYRSENYQGCFIKCGDRVTYVKTKEEKNTQKNNLRRSYNNFAKRRKEKILKIVREAAVNRYKFDTPVPFDDSKDKFELNKSDIEELRVDVDKILSEYAYDSTARIKLPNQILEMILFDYHKDEDGVSYKTIAFAKNLNKFKSGLCQLDLSEVSFEDVSLDFLKGYEKTEHLLNLEEINANIDLRDTYEYQKYKKVCMRYISFDGTDLSNNNLEELTSANSRAKIRYCYLGKTNLRVTKDTYADFEDSNLFKIDLSGIRIDLGEMKSVPNENLWFNNCDLQDTGIHIYSFGISDKEKFDQVYGNILSYEGCYVNDKEVMCSSKRYNIKENILAEYQDYEKNTINKTLSLVRNQITEFNDNKGEEDK